MSRDRRLGRGLAALLGTPLETESTFGEMAPPAAPAPVAVATGMGTTLSSPHRAGPLPAAAGDLSPAASSPGDAATDKPSADGFLILPLDQIEENPFQPRRDFSETEIASLAASLQEHDLLQPVLVRRAGDRYQLISGERRLRAARLAGWKTIPARIRQADDRLVAELAIVENLQRKDLNPVEKALSFKRYLDEHACTQDDLARRLKIDRSTIANLLRLLELPETILEGLRRGNLTAGHAKALLPLGDEQEQIALAQRTIQEGLSVRDVERIVAERIAELEGEPLPTPRSVRTRPPRSEQIAALEQQLRRALGAKVEIRASPRGRGKIVIYFQNHDEFDRLHQWLTGDVQTACQREAA